MIRVITLLGKHPDLLREIRDWLVLKHPYIEVKVFFSSPFIMQLGLYLEFFAHKNYNILITPNSYAIDYINPFISKEVNDIVLDKMRTKGTPFIIAKYDLNVNDVLLIYEMAILDIITLMTKPPF